MRKHLLTLAITLALPAFAHADAIQAGNGIAVVQPKAARCKAISTATS